MSDDDTTLRARLRSAVARLAPSQDGDPSPQARDERPIAIGREEHTQEPDKEDIERATDEYYANPLIRQPIRNFAADVCEPGYRVNVSVPDGADEPTVPEDYRFAEFRGMDLSDALETWLSTAAIIGGRFDRDFSDLLEDVVIDLRGRRGTAFVEHAYDDPREREYILGLRAFKAEETTAYHRSGKRILLQPDDAAMGSETVAIQPGGGDRTRFDEAPETPAGKAAAFVQFDDILGSFDERDDIPFALDDVTVISNDPDTGAIFGEPDTLSVIDRSEQLREMFDDTAQAIKAVGYGHWIVNVDTDDEDEARSLLDSFDPTNPERVNVTNYMAEAEQFDSDVPANVDQIQQQIEYILAALPTPLYRVGFAGDINRDVTSVQQDDYREEVARARDRLESAFHDLLHQKAREFMFGDAKADREIGADVQLVVEPPEAENPLEDEAVDPGEFSSLMQGLKAAAPGGAVEQVVPPHEIRETFLGLSPEPPEAPDADEGAVMALPDETDDRVQQTFREAYLEGGGGPFSDVPVIPTGIETLSDAWVRRWAEWIAAGRPEIAQSERLAEVAELDWNPALHPRDPETGQFVERPFNLPDDAPAFGDMSVGETLSYINENGGDVAGTVFDPDSPVTVGGVPNDATSLDDIAEGDGEDAEPEAVARVDEILSERSGAGMRVALRDHIGEVAGVGQTSLPVLDDEDDNREFYRTLAKAADAGLMGETESMGLTVREGTLGLYTFNDGDLTFSGDLNREQLKEFKQEGHLVHGSIEGLVLHELGHANHHSEIGDISDADEYLWEGSLASTRDGEFVGRERLELAEEEVSEYARTNPSEFVAEVFAGKALGQEFPDEIMKMYEEFDGPDTWRRYNAE